MTWADLGSHVATYLALAASALAAGALAGIALGTAAAHVRGARTPVLALTNIGRAVPSLALLTFMVPVLGLGFTPALAALIVLAAAPIAITTDVALRGVAPAAIDAARGLGMTPLQIALRVEWPLAFPVIFAGVRTAATEVIASAVLAAFIGAGGLGELITTGLQANQPDRLWTGVAAIAVIALLAEFALALAQRSLGEAA
ncbi:MAG TPA: ABC transporter permease [Candidatus Baltobacteraceae bacterium]|nr:ABC transporter permease [Candidatus Baltobacteraceae bacterium]